MAAEDRQGRDNQHPNRQGETPQEAADKHREVAHQELAWLE